ncbi:MAG: CBS domain-containing protein [Solirubrobacteraceae bacterium]
MSHLTRATDFSSWETTSVLAAMRPGVVWSPSGASVAQLASSMIQHGVHAVVVAASVGTAPLMASDLDIVRAALERADARACEIAREPAASLPTAAPLEQAIKMMAERYTAHLLITDADSGALAGIISSFDVAAVFGGHDPRYARILRPAPARPLASAAALSQARVEEVMHAGVITCTADVSLAAIAGTMAAHRVHCVAVAGVDRRRELFTWGLIADLDLVTALARGAQDEPAGAIAVTEPLAVKEGESLDRVASLMVNHDTSHVVVVGPDGLPAGIVSTLDVAEILAGAA